MDFEFVRQWICKLMQIKSISQHMFNTRKNTEGKRFVEWMKPDVLSLCQCQIVQS